MIGKLFAVLFFMIVIISSGSYLAYQEFPHKEPIKINNTETKYVEIFKNNTYIISNTSYYPISVPALIQNSGQTYSAGSPFFVYSLSENSILFNYLNSYKSSTITDVGTIIDVSGSEIIFNTLYSFNDTITTTNTNQENYVFEFIGATSVNANIFPDLQVNRVL